MSHPLRSFNFCSLFFEQCFDIADREEKARSHIREREPLREI